MFFHLLSPAHAQYRQSPWNTFLGDCSWAEAFLEDKSRKSVRWAPLHFLNAFLRAVGQVRRKTTYSPNKDRLLSNDLRLDLTKLCRYLDKVLEFKKPLN